MILFLDANVIFSATISPKGASNGLFRLAEQGYCHLITSPHAMTEVRRNINRKYPSHHAQLENLLAELTLTQEAPQEMLSWALNYLPDKDAPILAAAVAANAKLLVTGDKNHFGTLYGQILRGTKVSTISNAIDTLLPHSQPGKG